MWRSIDFDIVSSQLGELPGRFDRAVVTIINKAAFDGEAIAKTNARVDTGAMRSSVYVSPAGGKGGTYGEAVALAQSLGRPVGPEVMGGPKEAVLGAAAGYAAFVDLGTVFRPGDAWFSSAVYAVQGAFQAEAERLFAEALGA